MGVIGQRAFAAKVGVRVSSVQKQMHGGRLTPAVVIVDNVPQLDELKALELWYASTSKDDEDEDGDEDEGASVNEAKALYRARVRKEEATADMRELDYQKARGELLEEARVRKVLFEFTRRMRDRVENMPARIGAVQAAAVMTYVQGLSADELDPKVIESVVISTMMTECRAILEELSSEKPPAIA